MTNKANLESALWGAQRDIQGVGKDGYNDYSKYKYTSAEGMLTACRKALHDNQLTVRRTEFKYDSELHVSSTIKLSHHLSGESEISVVTFPAIIKKGTPSDKAIAAALTTSLSYYLRDLLLLPRSEDFDMDKRDDTRYQPNQQPPQPQKRIALFMDVPEKLNSLRSMVMDNDCLDKVLVKFGVDEIGNIKLTDANELKAFLDSFRKKAKPRPEDTLKKVLKNEVNKPEAPEIIQTEISNEYNKSFEEALKDSQNNMFRNGN